MLNFGVYVCKFHSIMHMYITLIVAYVNDYVLNGDVMLSGVYFVFYD